MRRIWQTAMLVALAGAAMAAQEPAQDRDTKAGKEPGKPEINLRVTPLIAFSPAKITVRAELKGGATDYEPFYCTTIVWDWDDGTSSENTPDCPPHEPGVSEVRRYHSATHVYQSGGRYTVRFRMKKGDKVVGSASYLVQVRAGIRDHSDIPE